MAVVAQIKKTVKGLFSAKTAPLEEHELPVDDIQSIEDTVTQEQIVAEINDKLAQSKEDRRPFELQWELNTNYLLGNQYCDIDPFTGEIIQIEKVFGFRSVRYSTRSHRSPRQGRRNWQGYGLL